MRTTSLMKRIVYSDLSDSVLACAQHGLDRHDSQRIVYSLPLRVGKMWLNHSVWILVVCFATRMIVSLRKDMA